MQLHQRLGKGAQGSVYLVENKADRKKWVLKKVRAQIVITAFVMIYKITQYFLNRANHELHFKGKILRSCVVNIHFLSRCLTLEFLCFRQFQFSVTAMSMGS